MHVFVAGASGALGRHLVPLLLAAGHDVTGTGRSQRSVETIHAQGANAIRMDGSSATSVARAVLEARPDVIIHQMTQLAGAADLRHFDDVFATSNLLRTKGLDHLIDAGRACGVKRFIVQSFCGWPYRRTGEHIKSEDAPLDDDPPRRMRATLAAIRYLEGRMLALSDADGIALRYGGFYGEETGLLESGFISQVRRGKAPLIGSGNGWWSFIHVADAAAATAAFVERGMPGVYNVVDDEPAPVHAWLPALAGMLGARPPRRIPAWIARLAAGDHLVKMMTEARAGSNAKIKTEVEWSPRYPSWREGFASVLAGHA